MKQYFSTKFGDYFNNLLEIECTKIYSDLLDLTFLSYDV